MTQIHLDYTEKINKFLFVKKSGGTEPVKIQLYINLLKFFVEHLASKGFSAETLPDPVGTVLEIKFDGLGDVEQQEYQNLFLDFIQYCRRPDQFGEAGAHKPPRHDIHKGEAKPKVQTIVRGFEKGKFERVEDKPNKRSFLLLLGFLSAAVVLAMVYFAPFGTSKGKGKISKVSVQVLMNRSELENYVNTIKEYIGNSQTVVGSWKKTGMEAREWTEDHEITETNLTLLLGKITGITPPKELGESHVRLMEINRQVVAELRAAKDSLNVRSQFSGDESRIRRTFNSVNVVMDSFSDTIDKFVAAINAICAYNNSSCKL